MLENFINLDAWNGLPDDLKAVVETANRAVNVTVLSEFVARNNDSLNTLVNEHGVELRPFNDEILALGASYWTRLVETKLAKEELAE